jgi:hypothetical protein
MNPKGPERDKSRYKRRPTTTVGNPTKELNIGTAILEIFERLIDNKIEIGTLQVDANNVATPDIDNDLIVISIRVYRSIMARLTLGISKIPPYSF